MGRRVVLAIFSRILALTPVSVTDAIQRSNDSPKKHRDIHLILIGKTGHGKSATGNSILGKRDAFKTSSFSSAYTLESNLQHSFVDGVNIHVHDTQGLCDTRDNKLVSREKIIQHFTDCMYQCEKSGVDCFLYCFNLASPRLTEEEYEIFQTLKDVFGQRMFEKYCIIIYTRGDVFKDSISFEDWCHDEKQTQELKGIFEMCKNRIALFNNEGSTDEISRQRENLLNMIDNMKSPEDKYEAKTFEKAIKSRKILLAKTLLEKIDPGIREEIRKAKRERKSMQKLPTKPNLVEFVSNFKMIENKLISIRNGLLKNCDEHVAEVFKPLLNEVDSEINGVIIERVKFELHYLEEEYLKSEVQSTADVLEMLENVKLQGERLQKEIAGFSLESINVKKIMDKVSYDLTTVKKITSGLDKIAMRMKDTIENMNTLDFERFKHSSEMVEDAIQHCEGEYKKLNKSFSRVFRDKIDIAIDDIIILNRYFIGDNEIPALLENVSLDNVLDRLIRLDFVDHHVDRLRFYDSYLKFGSDLDSKIIDASAELEETSERLFKEDCRLLKLRNSSMAVGAFGAAMCRSPVGYVPGITLMLGSGISTYMFDSFYTESENKYKEEQNMARKAAKLNF